VKTSNLTRFNIVLEEGLKFSLTSDYAADTFCFHKVTTPQRKGANELAGSHNSLALFELSNIVSATGAAHGAFEEGLPVIG
jgi:hypothetical protein